ncbi:MAG: sugar phosphate isomerase/epimerase family protein [Planctomycetota bacterium]|nr:sugar phosphate isomerase/epimerase family protein [Planctomycetota bacterium]
MKLSFMTFVCPEWELEKIVQFARDSDYDGVEIRVDAGHKHDISSQSSAEVRRSVKQLFDEEGVDIPCVATSVQFSSPDSATREENIKAAKANLDLATDLGARIVRMFAGGGVPELTDDAADRIAAAFDEVGEYAKASGVSPMLECGHDIIKSAAEGAEIIKRVKTPNFAVLWNHSHMDAETFDLLKSRLRHFHVHDDVLDPENENVLHLARKVQAIDYDGYVSLEIIKGHNLPEELLLETGKRLKGYMGQA